MSTLRIKDAPLLPDVNGTEKIPTGGRGDYAISVDQIKGHIFEDIGKELVGLGNVDNTSDLDKPVSTAQQAALNLKADKTYVDTSLDLKADKTNVYTRSETTLALSQKADLVNGTVPSNQLPSYVDDVVEYTTNTLPIVGESGKIYITTDTNRTWRWSGNQYVEISNGGVSDSTLKLQTPRKIANVDFDGTQNINIPHNNLTNRDAAEAHPASAISDASGMSQQKINDLSLTPFHFGGIGDGVYHKLSERYATIEDARVKYPTAQSLDDSIDLCALEAFFDHCHDNLVNANITLNAYVNRPLYVGMIRKDSNYKTKVYNGDLTLSNTQTDVEIPFLMRINAADTEWVGKLTFIGKGGSVKDRKQLGGLVIGDNGTDGSSGRVHITSVYCSSFKHFGFALSNDSIFPRMDNVHSDNIGSIGVSYANDNLNHAGVVKSFTSVDGQNNQYSLVTVDSVPSEYNHDTYSTAMVMFEGDPLPYRIQSIDKNTNTIKVYPRLNNKLTYSKLKYIYGCGMFWAGNNSGAGNFGHLQFILCGIGFWGFSLFGANINYLSTEFCGCGVTLGGQSNTVIGYNINNAYFEGNVWDYIQQWGNTNSPLIDFGMTHGFSADRVAELTSWRVTVWDEAREQSAFNASKITIGNRTYITDQNYNTSVDLSDPRDVLPVVTAGGDLLLTYESEYERISDLLGKQNKVLVITQNSSWRDPTAITIKVPDGWSLNGVLNGTVTTNPQKFATTLTVVKNADKSLRIFGESLYNTSGTTAERPSNAPTGFVYIDTTLVASGKPIYKTATGWVDAAGVAV